MNDPIDSSRMEDPALDNPDLYINRELSLLAFNRRVLEQARDPATPLLERLRFLCIANSNLDEFFEIRVAGLMQQVEYGATQVGPEKMSPADTLSRIGVIAHDLVAEQYQILNEEMLPALEREGVAFVRRANWTQAESEWVADYFQQNLMPILTPIRLDPAHPFPKVINKSLHFIVLLSGEDAFSHAGGMAVVHAPRVFPRLIRLPEAISNYPHQFIFLSSIIHDQIGNLFPGMEVNACHQFRVTRNSDLFVDTEEVDDLARALQGELSSRRYGAAVRLEVDDTCPEEVVNFLLGRFEMDDANLYRVNGPVNLHRLMALPDLVNRPDLKYPGFVPGLPARIARFPDMFAAVSAGDLLLHHPFESFSPVIDFVRQAAVDPTVRAIKQTLYRTGSESALVEALASAARAGKEVTVVIELRARFDEQANIDLASRLQESGAHVVYGVVGYKTHAKMLLIVRQEGAHIRRYVHLGTGNYHAQTARAYTDYSFFTADPEIGEDVHTIFLQLTSLGKVTRLKRLLQSPFTLNKALLKFVENEAQNARDGKPARIIAKMNALTESGIIRALYAASQAGVQIDLIIRGVCSLKPGIPGVSENIRVRSIVGRFLEHSRVFYFENGGDPQVFCSSADWMGRNLFQRVETCFPISDPELAKRVIEQGLKPYLDDNTQAWELHSDGTYARVTATENGVRTAQSELIRILASDTESRTSGKIPHPLKQRRIRRVGKKRA
jgi:polyphosphate kinase